MASRAAASGLRWPAVAVALYTLAGCATVAPYEREDLASPAMDVSAEAPEQEFTAHVFDAREGATGGGGSAGGGCGCN